VTWKTRHLCHFTSEQNKVSKSEVFEKVIGYLCNRFLNVVWRHVPKVIKKLENVC